MGGGIGTIIVGWVLPMIVPSLPHWVQIALLFAGAILIIASVIAARRKEVRAVGDTYNNSGNNFGHIGPVNIGRQEFVLTDRNIAEIIARIPRGRIVNLTVVGNARAQQMGERIAAAIEGVRHPLNRFRVGMMAPPPEYPITFNDNGNMFAIVFAPDV